MLHLLDGRALGRRARRRLGGGRGGSDARDTARREPDGDVQRGGREVDVERLHDRGHGELPAVAPVPPRDDRHARVRDSVRVRVRDIFGGELRHHVRGGLRGPPGERLPRPPVQRRVLLPQQLEFSSPRGVPRPPLPAPEGRRGGDCSGEGAGPRPGGAGGRRRRRPPRHHGRVRVRRRVRRLRVRQDPAAPRGRRVVGVRWGAASGRTSTSR